MKKSTLIIEGMSCGHCVLALKKELDKLPLNIIDVQVGTAIIEYDEEKISKQDIQKVIDKAGYELISAI